MHGYRVMVNDGAVDVGRILICTDWAAPELLAPLGIDIPVAPLPKEILVTTPRTPAVKPILISLEHHIAVNQIGRGSVVFTVSRARTGTDTRSTGDFLAFAAPLIVDLVPGLADTPVLRTWAGRFERDTGYAANPRRNGARWHLCRSILVSRLHDFTSSRPDYVRHGVGRGHERSRRIPASCTSLRHRRPDHRTAFEPSLRAASNHRMLFVLSDYGYGIA